jgi:hypothetical protein
VGNYLWKAGRKRKAMISSLHSVEGFARLFGHPSGRALWQLILGSIIKVNSIRIKYSLPII